MKDIKLAVVMGAFAAGIIALLLIASIGAGLIAFNKGQAQPGVSQPAPSNTAVSTGAGSDEGLLIFGMEVPGSATATSAPDTRSFPEKLLEVVFRLLLAVILSAILAFRPRQNVPLFRRSLFVSQTQILLAVVAAALMMIVGDNTARAFAIFAAASLVRFRTNIKDPKEITVLLISLALGLAAGVGRWGLGTALCLFALALLWLLEYNESENVYRSMEVTVRTKNTDTTHEVLKKVFRRHRLDGEIRQLSPPDEANPVGEIVYYINLRLNLSTDELSDRIMEADPANIEKIQWSKTKPADDIYK